MELNQPAWHHLMKSLCFFFQRGGGLKNHFWIISAKVALVHILSFISLQKAAEQTSRRAGLLLVKMVWTQRQCRPSKSKWLNWKLWMLPGNQIFLSVKERKGFKVVLFKLLLLLSLWRKAAIPHVQYHEANTHTQTHTRTSHTAWGCDQENILPQNMLKTLAF